MFEKFFLLSVSSKCTNINHFCTTYGTLRFDNKRYHILLNCRWQLVILDKELGSGSGECNNVSRKAFCFMIQVSTMSFFFQIRIALF